MADSLPTGSVTFLYTDIEGSTPLWEFEPVQMKMALERHDVILQESIASFGGHVYKIIGDAFQAAFEVSSDAVRASLAAQRSLVAEPWPTSTPLRVRMGLHAGHAIAQGDDYTTTHTLNRVARIMAAAHGGQVLLSEAVGELISDDLPEGASLRDMGRHQLKGLTQLEHLLQVVVPDLPAQFPPLNTLEGSANNLPAQLTTFIGREAEVAELKELLAKSRLTTLTGSGGCGKTRLSLHVAREVQAEYPNGVWLVELAPLSDPALIPPTLVAELGLRDDGHRPILEILTDFLRSKTLLLVLDNCEHLIQACAQLSETLLRSCPKLRILASSRERLGVPGEFSYRVPSFAVPDPEHLPSMDKLGNLDAFRLFVERAATARPGFALTAKNAPAIAHICGRLDGIPLAIELAASRVGMLSTEQIATRLDDRFRLLTGGSRTAMPRQQTLRAMMDWSYSLLSEPERILFNRNAVFVDGWTLEAAEAVCSGNGFESSEVLDLLTRLVDKSLVVTKQVAEEVRYHRLETIRQYSREKFAESDEAATVRDQHLEFYVRFAEATEEHLQGREPRLWSQRLEAEQGNLRAALEWGLMNDPDSALRMVGALRLFWNASGYSPEGFRWTQQALERVDGLQGREEEGRQAAKAKALAGLAWAYTSQGDNEQARLAAEQSASLYRERVPKDKLGLAIALILLARVEHFLGLRAEAEGSFAESIALARAATDPFAEAYALSTRAQVMIAPDSDLDGAKSDAEKALGLARDEGLRYLYAAVRQNLGRIAGLQMDPEEARQQLRLALAIFEEDGAHFNATLVKSDLAHLERYVGNHRQALEHYRETILAFRDFGQRGAVAHQLECFGFIAIAQDDFERAIRLLGAAEAWREQGKTTMTPEEQIEYDEQVEVVRGQMASELFSKTWADGRALTMEQAVSYATEEDSNL